MKNKKGFTLIELLIVIAIIATLGSVLAVGIRDARGRAYDASAKVYARDYAQAQTLALDQTGRYQWVSALWDRYGLDRPSGGDISITYMVTPRTDRYCTRIHSPKATRLSALVLHP